MIDDAGNYPAPPYALNVGAVFPNLALRGYRDAAKPFVDVRMADRAKWISPKL